jgi:hypothetical protein
MKVLAMLTLFAGATGLGRLMASLPTKFLVKTSIVAGILALAKWRGMLDE